MRKNRYFFILCTVFFLLSPPVYANETPETAPTGVTLVDAKEAMALQTKGAMLVDTRAAIEYAEEHIIGAMNVPYREKSAKTTDYDDREDRFSLGRLPPDKKTPLIMYCNGSHCWKSYKAAIKAVAAGYSDVYWLRTGANGWKSIGGTMEE